MTPDLFITIIVVLALAVLLICVLVALMAVVESIKSDPVPKPQPPASWIYKQGRGE